MKKLHILLTSIALCTWTTHHLGSAQPVQNQTAKKAALYIAAMAGIGIAIYKLWPYCQTHYLRSKKINASSKIYKHINFTPKDFADIRAQERIMEAQPIEDLKQSNLPVQYDSTQKNVIEKVKKTPMKPSSTIAKLIRLSEEEYQQAKTALSRIKGFIKELAELQPSLNQEMIEELASHVHTLHNRMLQLTNTFSDILGSKNIDMEEDENETLDAHYLNNLESAQNMHQKINTLYFEIKELLFTFSSKKVHARKPQNEIAELLSPIGPLPIERSISG